VGTLFEAGVLKGERQGCDHTVRGMKDLVWAMKSETAAGEGWKEWMGSVW